PMTPQRELYGGFKFQNKGYEFYKHPPAEAVRINKLIYDVRLKPALVQRLITDFDQVANDYGLTAKEREVAQLLIDVGSHEGKVSDLVPKFVEMGAHPLAALLGIHVTYAAVKKFEQESAGRTGDK